MRPPELWAGLLSTPQLSFLFCWSGDRVALCLTRATAFLFLPLLEHVVVVVPQGNTSSAGQTSLTRPVFLPATRTGPLHPQSATARVWVKRKSYPSLFFFGMKKTNEEVCWLFSNRWPQFVSPTVFRNRPILLSTLRDRTPRATTRRYVASKSNQNGR